MMACSHLQRGSSDTDTSGAPCTSVATRLCGCIPLFLHFQGRQQRLSAVSTQQRHVRSISCTLNATSSYKLFTLLHGHTCSGTCRGYPAPLYTSIVVALFLVTPPGSHSVVTLLAAWPQADLARSCCIRQSITMRVSSLSVCRACNDSGLKTVTTRIMHRQRHSLTVTQSGHNHHRTGGSPLESFLKPVHV